MDKNLITAFGTCYTVGFSIVKTAKVDSSLNSKIMSTQPHFDEEKKIWSAINTPTILNPKNSLGHAILWSLAKDPNKVFQV